MYFSLTSKDIRIYTDPSTGNTFLSASCKDTYGGWLQNTVRLDDKLTYSEELGRFLMLGIPGLFVDQLSDQFKPGSLQLKGKSLLVGTAIDSLGGKESAICLDFCFDNTDGQLVFQAPSDDVRKRMVKFSCDPETAVLKGLVLGWDGLLHYQELPLGEHYENDNGYLKPKRDGDFYMTSDKWKVTSQLEFSAHLGDGDGGWRWDTYPVYQDINVDTDGNLTINDPVEYGLFDLRGELARFLEKIPIVGYEIALIDVIKGDPDEAKRAAAECTYSTIVLGASIAGATLGGPIGAALGSSIAALAAPYVKSAIAETISDPRMRKQLTGVSVYNLLMGEVFAIAGIGIGQIGSELSAFLVEDLTEAGIEDVYAEMIGWTTKQGVNKLDKEDLRKIVDVIVDAVTNGRDKDWIVAQLGGWPEDGYNPNDPLESDGEGDPGIGLPPFGSGSDRPGRHVPVGRI